MNRLGLAYQFASDLSELFIAVAAGILALTISFAKEILKAPTKKQVSLLSSAWILYLVSILTGFWSLMALTGSLADLTKPLLRIDFNARFPVGLQIISFTLATFLLMRCGRAALLAFDPQKKSGAAPSAPPECTSSQVVTQTAATQAQSTNGESARVQQTVTK